jgi:hypothetical protein
MENSNNDDVLVPVKECDYLEEDRPIRGQNWACISFISPENVLKDKNIYFFEKFTKDFSKKMNEIIDNLKLKYQGESSHLDLNQKCYNHNLNIS